MKKNQFYLFVSTVVLMAATGWPMVVRAAAGKQLLHGHVPAIVNAGLSPVDRLPATNRMRLAIALPLRNQAALTNLLHEIYDPTSPHYHHYLTPGQFAEQFGPSESDYQATVAFAQAHGLTVTSTSSNRHLLDVSGAVSDVEKAFHVTMRVYPHPTESRTFYAPDTEPSLDLTVPVERICGLDTYSQPHPLFKAMPMAKAQPRTASVSSGSATAVALTQAVPLAFGTNGSGPYGSFAGKDFRTAYLPGVTNNGAGQSIALIEFDGYTASDITYYETNGAGTNDILPSCTLSNVLLEGFNGQPSGNGGEIEVSLDIEILISMTTNLTGLYVYEVGPDGVWDAMLNRIATDDLSRQISSSWEQPNENDDTVADGIFQQMAAQGQSYIQASGDAGAYAPIYASQVPFPCGNPYVTSVGGTCLFTDTNGAWSSEIVWDSDYDGDYEPIGGTTGGSTMFSIPYWQANVSMANNLGSTTTRNFPDVASVANNIYVRCDTNDLRIDGTSCAAPQWAGIIAMVNQQEAARGQPPIGFANPAIYALAAQANPSTYYRDVTNGSSSGLSYLSSPIGTTNIYYNAVSGYDLCTGWGTPGSNIVNALVAANAAYNLVTSTRLEGSAASSDGVVLTVNPDSGSWTAITNTAFLPSWLHLTVGAGTGGTNLVFSFDANPPSLLPSGPRTGTLTIAGQTLTVTQLGSAYQQSSLVTNLVTAGLASSNGVAVDTAGNVYIADTGNNVIKKWNPANNTVTTLVAAALGLNHPQGVAVDAAGDVFIADTGNNAIKELAIGGSTLITNVATGLNTPTGVAVDNFGDVFIADNGNNAIKELPVGSTTVTTLISTGLSHPTGIAVDGAGNIYFADSGNNAVKEVPADTTTAVSLVSAGLNNPTGVAADAARNIYIADSGDNAIKVWTAASNTVSALVAVGLNHPAGVAMDVAGDVFIDDTANNAIKEKPYAFLIPTALAESATAGTDVINPVMPTAANLTGPFTPTSDQSWLTILGANNGVVSFAFTTNNTVGSRTAHITVLGQPIAVTQASPYTISSTNRLEGPVAGADTIVLAVNPNNAAWTNTANATWLHLTAANQTGVCSTNLVFNFDANPGVTRSGTLTIEGMTVTVTQAASTYVAASMLTNLVATGLENPNGLVVDNAGNVDFSDASHDNVDKWIRTNNSVTTVVAYSNTNALLPAYEPFQPEGLALDAAGNLYIADDGNTEIEEIAANGSAGTNLVKTSIFGPNGIVVDSAGNPHFTVFSQLQEWSPINVTLTTNFSVYAGYFFNGVTLDGAGNTYLAYGEFNAIIKLPLGSTNPVTITTNGLNYPGSMAVDGAGNIYIADSGNNAIKKWTALNGVTSTVVGSGVSNPLGVAVDAAGNVYFSNTASNAVEEVQFGFVDATTKNEPLAAGNDSLSPVLPATANLTGPFVPTSDSSWVTITGVTNEVVSFSFAANTTIGSRIAHINVLGQNIAVTQASPYSLGTLARLEGPTTGTDSVVLAVSADFPAWTNTANATWLHLSTANQIGTGSTNILFTYDANPGTTRVGTLNIGGFTFTVTQAGSTYVAAGVLTNLVTSTTVSSNGVAVDNLGNAYLANSASATIQEWTPTNNSVTTLVSSGLTRPTGVAVDASRNLYVADIGSATIKKWSALTASLSSLITSGLSNPYGVTVDGLGNVFVADAASSGRMEELSASSGLLSTNISAGLTSPAGVAMDAADNLYLADTGDNALKELLSGNSSVSSLIASGLSTPVGVAVDGAGNVYVADTSNNAVKKWTAASATVTTTVSGLNHPTGVAVDNAGNLFIADNSTNVLKELPRAFVDTTSKSETPAPGTDVLPVILPATADLGGPFTPVTDQSWLAITSTNGGIVSFAFTANNGAPRTGHITVLGQVITVTQGSPYSLGSIARLVGPVTGTDSVLLAESTNVGSWTATANVSWLHLGASSQTGSGNSRVAFSYDTNSGATRSGTLTVAGLTFTVTQAGSTYSAAGVVTDLIPGLNYPYGIAPDNAGNLYVADTYHNAVKKWTPTNNTVTTLVSGLSYPQGVAVDAAGNVYIADTGNNDIKKWTAATGLMTTNVTGLFNPEGVAVDGAGDIFIADTYNNAVKESIATNGAVNTISSVYHPLAVAADTAGNAYFMGASSDAIYKWAAANSNVTTVLTATLPPTGVAVDALGNVDVAEDGYNVTQWAVANSNQTILADDSVSYPYSCAVDAAGNVYMANLYGDSIDELPYAFVDATAKSESLAGGSDTLPVVLPATANLSGPFAPLSDSSWLTITSTNGGIVSFACSANTGPGRTAHLSLLGQSITVTQGGSTYAIGTTNLLVGAGAGSNGVVLGVSFSFSTWTNSVNATWLHLSTANQSGTGSTNIIFSYDANPGETRVGTLTIEGVMVTVTQAGSTYVPANLVTNLVTIGLASPAGVTVDGAGNVYFTDAAHNALKKWTVANTLTTLVSTGLDAPWGVALDNAGDVYLADRTNNAIKEWSAASGTVSIVVSGLSDPTGVALDAAGNVYFSDTGANLIAKWSNGGGTLTTNTTGLSAPAGIAVDAAGNIYFADAGNSAIKEWSLASSNVTTTVSGLSNPLGVAVDGGGNIYFADSGNNAIKERFSAGGAVISVTTGLNHPAGVAVDSIGNIYFADAGNNAIKELPLAFVDPTPKAELASAGSDALPAVIPATANLSGSFAPVSDSSWLTIIATNNGVVSFTFQVNNTGSSRVGHINVLGQSIAVTQGGATFNLGASQRLEGPAAGSDSVVLAVVPNNGAWVAATNANWLHLSPAFQSGNGSTNVIFSFDSNPGATRIGTLTVAGQTLTITQVAAGYVASGSAGFASGLVTGLNSPQGVGVDTSGNVYYPQYGLIEEWVAASGYDNYLFSVSSPDSIAVDNAGNVYVADSGNNSIEEWSVTSGGVTTLASGLNDPSGVAVDSAGNVYFSDTGNAAIKKWTASNGSVTTLISSGLSSPSGIAVDAAGNVYFADDGYNTINEWSAASGTITNLVTASAGLNYPRGLAVDGAGNVYIADTYNDAIKEWLAVSNTLTMLVSAASGLSYPQGVAVDVSGNVYVADTGNNTIDELPYAFVNTSPKLESVAGGSDSLPPVLPITANLGGIFTPTSNVPWLTIISTNNGVVSYSFPPNTNATSQTGEITVLGQPISITQYGAYFISVGTRVEGPGSGNDSIVLSVNPSFRAWTNSANDSWLHLNADSETGSGSTNVFFSYDANYGLTRTGTLTIAGLTLNIIQAGSSYVPATLITNLVNTGLNMPSGVAVDTSGNVYIADTGDNAIKEWTPILNTVTTLVNSGLNNPEDVAVDGAGNLYIADTYNDAVEEWSPAINTLTPLVSDQNWNLQSPEGVAVDGAGNVYIANTYNYSIDEWTAADSNVTSIVSSGLNQPAGVAVDAADNVYIGDTYNYTVDEWLLASSNLSTVVSSSLYGPTGVAVDSAGNIYIANTFDNSINEWNVANGTLLTLTANVSQPTGVAVDGAGNVYFTDNGNNVVDEMPYAFVDASEMWESGTAGSDELPGVLPATANLTGPFAPTSDSAWLAITGTSGGVVSYSFTANNGPTRTANISLLGQTIPVTQYSLNSYSLGAYSALESPAAGSDSVILSVNPNTGTWTAATDGTAWLHLGTAYQSGTGSTNIVFSFDANPGATRSGYIIIAGEYLLVTQAGSTYVAATLATNLVSTGLNNPSGLSVDVYGNVYIANAGSNSVVKWTLTNNVASALVSTGLSNPAGLSADNYGDVFIADTAHNAIQLWNNSTSNLTSSVTGLNHPTDVILDEYGNLYIADSGSGTIKESAIGSGSANNLVTGLIDPTGVALDGAGNVYIADRGTNKIYEWQSASSNVTALAFSGLSSPAGVAVDGAGNIYIADITNNLIRKWTAASNSVSTLLATGLKQPTGVAIDASGNLYVTDNGSNQVVEVTHAFVDPTARGESGAAGSDSLPGVLPYTVNLGGVFTPASDQSWLTIISTNYGAVSFSFTANIGSSRTAHITVLGQVVAITQSGPSFTLGATNRLEGPTAGTDSIVLAVVPNIATWTASANASWLHLSTGYQSGAGSTNLIFTFDANVGATRTGTLTIGGQTLTITQAGAAYVAADVLTNLVTSGLASPRGLVVDGSGNVYFADNANNAVKEWLVASNSVTTSPWYFPSPVGVTLDAMNNLYVVLDGYNYIGELTASNNSLAWVIYYGLNEPAGVAVDHAGNIYIADTGDATVKEWLVASGTLTNLVSTGLISPTGIALDAAGNVYIADNGTNVIYEWLAASSTVTTIVPASSGLNGPASVAVDGGGNIYIADTGNNAIKKWSAATHYVSTLVTGLNSPMGVAVDALGNIYFADTGNNEIKELTQAYVDPTTKTENAAAGSDVLPIVLPAAENLNAPFAPFSDASWLTVNGAASGVTSFAFTATTTNRTGHISILGQATTITQTTTGGGVTAPVLMGETVLPNGAFEFTFSNSAASSFTVLSSTNITLALTNWTVLGTASNLGSGLFEFTLLTTTNHPQQFFRVRSP